MNQNASRDRYFATFMHDITSFGEVTEGTLQRLKKGDFLFLALPEKADNTSMGVWRYTFESVDKLSRLVGLKTYDGKLIHFTYDILNLCEDGDGVARAFLTYEKAAGYIKLVVTRT